MYYMHTNSIKVAAYKKAIDPRVPSSEVEVIASNILRSPP